ncbi:type IV secretory system conjugative DNA transfer family protein, partial [Sinorhizobium medicae]
ELMGLPRRTKVEQIRERDLMMPQEVRQMPENKMILLIEGQRPIFGEKLRFFQTQPFKSAEAFSQANIPQVPEVDYLSPKPVPATTPEYASGGDPSVEIPSPAPAKEEKPLTAAAAEAAPVMAEPAAGEKAAAPAKRAVNRKALRTNPKATAANTGGAEASASLDAMEARIKAIEEGLKPKAAQLKEVVETKAEKLGDKSPTKRRNILDIFSATVPDPVEVGVTAE